MGTTFAVEVPRGQRLRRSMAPMDAEWIGGQDDETPDELAEGGWNVAIPGVSTRSTHLDVQPTRLVVTVAAAASPEDWDLALGLVRAAAQLGDSQVHVVPDDEDGSFPVSQLHDRFGPAEQERQLAIDLSTLAALARGGQVVSMDGPGPVGVVSIGPRAVTEIAPTQPGATGRLLGVMRRVLWPGELVLDLYSARRPDGDAFTVAFLHDETTCVIPPTDRIGLRAPADEVMLIERSELPRLPLDLFWLDDRTQRLAAAVPRTWSAVCDTARSFQVT